MAAAGPLVASAAPRAAAASNTPKRFILILLPKDHFLKDHFLRRRLNGE
jgi:hypothetical protein